MRQAALFAVLAATLSACASTPNVAETCAHWEEMKEALDQGVPKVGAYVIVDDMQEAANRSGHDRLPDLVSDFNEGLVFLQEGEPISGDLLATGREIEDICQQPEA